MEKPADIAAEKMTVSNASGPPHTDNSETILLVRNYQHQHSQMALTKRKKRGYFDSLCSALHGIFLRKQMPAIMYSDVMCLVSVVEQLSGRLPTAAKEQYYYYYSTYIHYAWHVVI